MFFFFQQICVANEFLISLGQTKNKHGLMFAGILTFSFSLRLKFKKKKDENLVVLRNLIKKFAFNFYILKICKN